MLVLASMSLIVSHTSSSESKLQRYYVETGKIKIQIAVDSWVKSIVGKKAIYLGRRQNCDRAKRCFQRNQVYFFIVYRGPA